MLLHEVGLAVLVPEVPPCAAVPALAQSKALAMVTATTLIENDSGERAEQTDEGEEKLGILERFMSQRNHWWLSGSSRPRRCPIIAYTAYIPGTTHNPHLIVITVAQATWMPIGALSRVEVTGELRR